MALRRDAVQRLLGHVIARALAGHEIAIIQHALIGQHHGVARHRQALGHLSGGGDGFLARQLSVEDGRDQGLADLGLQAGMFAAPDMDKPVAQ